MINNLGGLDKKHQQKGVLEAFRQFCKAGKRKKIDIQLIFLTGIARVDSEINKI